ncbi:NADPH--cytochrome P450 reductase [Microthyrium microscopicum]|uniref:Bifunctional cytochrome P450/NADPH--P450 reductase n=1 Tax=Microthyrium microscopicum TaxID=703497 RepID=A0A6A6U159_9PEZI|nr:NADPH--cytochrome P450 reductase [Microthyrium microscopicum]
MVRLTYSRPQPLPLIGNLLDLQDDVPIHALERLADIYGPIYKITMRGKERIIVTSFKLFDELCDENRFWKVPPAALVSGPTPPAEGLFSARSSQSPDWIQAHKILMPAFGPLAIEEMFDEMYDIASQMVMLWARKDSGANRVLVSKEMSNLTFDTIALCAMDFRFNSFYQGQGQAHPFVTAMSNLLLNRSNSQQLSSMLKKLLPSTNEQLRKDAQYQKNLSEQLVKHRKDNPTDKKDLLNAMIYGKDPTTGETMRDELVAANMITFLVAGHETTSGLLSFALLNMLKNPSTLFAARQEVDRVVGKEKITSKHLSELIYVHALLKETLRLTPTAPAITRGPRPENKEDPPRLDRKYELPREGSGIVCLLTKIQRDPEVWGVDVEEFKPERMLDEHMEKIPRNAWKPFGTGLRGCIGRSFAIQEAVLAVALILQNFDVAMDDPSYEMKIVQTLTIKPKDFYIRPTLRKGVTVNSLQERLVVGTAASSIYKSLSIPQENQSDESTNKLSITVAFGSNTGTCQALAQKVASQARQQGYQSSVVDLDAMTGNLPTDEPVIIITASYEGQPPDNAARFVAYMEHLKDPDIFNGVNFAVFGCGHHDWSATYQRIPTLIDEALLKLGASRICERGSSDAASGDMFGDFASWTEKIMWPALLSISPRQSNPIPQKMKVPTLDIQISHQGRDTHLQQNLKWGQVVEARRLTSAGQPEKWHTMIKLATGMTYQVGDYLAVLPMNPEGIVKRVIQRFNLPWDAIITIKDSGTTTLPTDSPLPVSELLKGYVELSDPVTRRVIEALIEDATNASEKEELNLVLGDEKSLQEMLDRRTSILEFLEQNPTLATDFSKYLSLLSPLRPRHYSISSSPLVDPTCCTLTYTVIDALALSNTGKKFQGVTGTYLRSLKPGDQLLVSVRSTNKVFRLPSTPEQTPLIMFCAGSGLAPFRGFIQERAVMIKEGQRKLAPALLFVGCRTPTGDGLYLDEFAEWSRIGAVDIRYAFSRAPERSQGCRYVQDRMLSNKKDIIELWKDGAKVYICGSKNVAQTVGKAARILVEESAKEAGKDMTQEELDDWVKARKNDRIVSDVFA